MAINIEQNMISAEKPNVLKGERIYVYVPKATNNSAGIASFSNDYFYVDADNKVHIKLTDPFEKESLVKLNNVDFKKNSQGAIDINWVYAHNPVSPNNTNGYGLMKIGENSIGYLRYNNGLLEVDYEKVVEQLKEDTDISILENRMTDIENVNFQQQEEIDLLDTDVENIKAVIPSQASAVNKLVDMATMNSSISANAASFRGNWTTWADVPSDSEDYPADDYGNKKPNQNDYLVLENTSTYGDGTRVGTWRFKYSGDWDTDGKNGWHPEFQINEEPFTAAQQAAIDSGITLQLVNVYNGYANRFTAVESSISSVSERVSDNENDIVLLQGDITTLSTNLSTEVTNRQNADNTINANISTLQGLVQDNADDISSLDDRVTANASAISTETTNRQNADTSLQSQITQNNNAIVELQTNKADKSSLTLYELKANKVGTLDNPSNDTYPNTVLLNSIKTALEQAISVISTNLNNEITNRQNGDSTLQTAVDAAGHSLELSVDTTTYVLTARLKDADGNVLGQEQTVDLPIESLILSVSFDDTTDELVITLQNGTTTRVPLSGIISGLQSEITSTNKLASDLVDDTNQTNKFVTVLEKNTWNAKQDAISDLATIRNLATTALQPNDNITNLTNNAGYTKVAASATNGYIKINNVDTKVYELPSNVAFTDVANTFTQGQIISRTDSGPILKLTSAAGDTNFLLERQGGATCVLESGGSIGLFGTMSNHGLQIRTNYVNRMSFDTSGGVTLATAPAANSNSNQIATTKWVNDKGYITGISSGDVISALGFTPYNSTNPNGYQTASQVETIVDSRGVRYDISNQGLTSAQQANARANIGAGTSNFDGLYSSLTGLPTLGTASSKDTGSTSGTIPLIGSNGKLPSSIIPASAITDTFVVSSEAAMLALSSAEQGDVCVRTDLSKSFILKEEPYSVLANWQELLTPTGGGSDVISVNGQTGAVVLTASDVGAQETLSTIQLAAVNSGITSALVTQIGTNTTNITTLNNDKMDKANPTGTGAFSLNRKGDTTIGINSFAEGYSTTASGNASHAEGYSTTASGNYSHAEGRNTTASGNYSHAEGHITTASGNYSHAEGYNTTASGNYSHAEGRSTTAQRKSQHVFGEYNVADTGGTDETTRGNYVEIVGNGTSSNSRSNARTLDWSGNEVLAGTLQATGLTDGTTTKTMTEILADKQDPLNQNQLNAVNSGITSALVTQIGTNQTNIANKVDKTTTANRIYGTTSDGRQITLTYGTEIAANYIVRRKSDMQIGVPVTPNSDLDATSKSYVDNRLTTITELYSGSTSQGSTITLSQAVTKFKWVMLESCEQSSGGKIIVTIPVNELPNHASAWDAIYLSTDSQYHFIYYVDSTHLKIQAQSGNFGWLIVRGIN